MNRSTTKKTKKSSLSKTRRKNSKKNNHFKIVTERGDEFMLKEYNLDMETKVIKIYYGNGIPCVEVHITKDNEYAILETVSYNERCSLKGIENKSGTQYMCRVTLKYVIDKYPFIQKIQISDTSAYTIDGNINNNISLISARYLLQGRPALYQNYCNAYPINDTINIIEKIKKYRDIIDKRIEKYMKKNDDWTPKNIRTFILPGIPINKTMATEWEVTRDIINNYGVKYRVYKSQSGGGIDFDSIDDNNLPYFTQFIK